MSICSLVEWFEFDCLLPGGGGQTGRQTDRQSHKQTDIANFKYKCKSVLQVTYSQAVDVGGVYLVEAAAVVSKGLDGPVARGKGCNMKRNKLRQVYIQPVATALQHLYHNYLPKGMFKLDAFHLLWNCWHIFDNPQDAQLPWCSFRHRNWWIRCEVRANMKTSQDRKWLPRIHLICCRGVKWFLTEDFCQKLFFWLKFGVWVLSKFELLSFVTIWVVEFCHT